MAYLTSTGVHEIIATWGEMKPYWSALFKSFFNLTGWQISFSFPGDGLILLTVIKNQVGYQISVCTLPMQGKHYSEIIFEIFNPVGRI